MRSSVKMQHKTKDVQNLQNESSLKGCEVNLLVTIYIKTSYPSLLLYSVVFYDTNVVELCYNRTGHTKNIFDISRNVLKLNM